MSLTKISEIFSQKLFMNYNLQILGIKLYVTLLDGRPLLTKSIKIPHSLPTNETDTDLVIQS